MDLTLELIAIDLFKKDQNYEIILLFSNNGFITLTAEIIDVVLLDLNGERRYLSEWKGKLIAINFWATWCAPCREEIPAFVELQEKYATQGLQFIGIALQQADEVRDFIEEYNVNYPSLVGGDEVIKVASQLGNNIGAMPYTVIINSKGKIAYTHRGPLSKIEAEAVIKNFL